MADDDVQQKIFHLLDVFAVEVGATRAGVERVETLAIETRHDLDRVERRLGRVETRIEHIETEVAGTRGVNDRLSALESRNK